MDDHFSGQKHEKKVFSKKRLGNLVALRLIPALLLLPLVTSLVVLFEDNSGLLMPESTALFVALIYTLFLVIFILVTVKKVNQIEQKHLEENEKIISERTFELINLNKILETEIKERIRAEKKVDEERKRFNDVLELMPAYIILLSEDYHVPYANRFFRERFGESNGERCYEYLFNRTEPCEICETFKSLNPGISIKVQVSDLQYVKGLLKGMEERYGLNRVRMVRNSYSQYLKIINSLIPKNYL